MKNSKFFTFEHELCHINHFQKFQSKGNHSRQHQNLPEMRHCEGSFQINESNKSNFTFIHQNQTSNITLQQIKLYFHPSKSNIKYHTPRSQKLRRRIDRIHSNQGLLSPPPRHVRRTNYFESTLDLRQILVLYNFELDFS
jgi:hypothetical protein